MSPQQQVLGIIRSEHQSLGAVINALRHVFDEVARGTLTPDYKLAWSILYYIEEFPERLHHPKEDQVLFPRLRAHDPQLDTVLDALERQHANGRPYLDALKTWLGRMEAESPGAAEEFTKRLNTYASFHDRHMADEEEIVLPRANEILTEQDWQDIAASFAENNDPLTSGTPSSSAWFRQLFRRIVTLVPEPWGVGARR